MAMASQADLLALGKQAPTSLDPSRAHVYQASGRCRQCMHVRVCVRGVGAGARERVKKTHTHKYISREMRCWVVAMAMTFPSQAVCVGAPWYLPVRGLTCSRNVAHKRTHADPHGRNRAGGAGPVQQTWTLPLSWVGKQVTCRVISNPNRSRKTQGTRGANAAAADQDDACTVMDRTLTVLATPGQPVAVSVA